MALDDWLLSRARISGKQHKRVTIDDKMTFFQQLASLVSSGTPLLQAVQVAAAQTQSTRFRAVLEDVAARVSAGVSLEHAMANHPDIFEGHWVSLIGTGEVSGKMDQVLADLNNQIRETRETMRKLSGSLIYPAVLLFVAVIDMVFTAPEGSRPGCR